MRVRRRLRDGQPSSDLCLSPDHAVFVGGVLIPVRYLINGATIVQEPARARHLLARRTAAHDMLLAEGLPCESYLDTGNRAAFENGDGPTTLHADFARRVWQEQACAELVMDGPDLQAVRSLLLARAEMLGHAVTADPALRLRVDGQMLRPAGPGRHTASSCRTPPGASICCRAAPPRRICAMTATTTVRLAWPFPPSCWTARRFR